jgi:hypothetical protein
MGYRIISAIIDGIVGRMQQCNTHWEQMKEKFFGIIFRKCRKTSRKHENDHKCASAFVPCRRQSLFREEKFRHEILGYEGQ